MQNLTDSIIQEIHDAAIEASSSDEVFEIIAPLLSVQAGQVNVVDALIDVIIGGHLTIEHAINILSDIYEAHEENDDIVVLIGSAMEAARDIDLLNSAPPEHDLFYKLIKRLSDISLATKGTAEEVAVIDALSSTARLMARQHDDLAERSYNRLVELLPDTSWAHYNQGLFFKTRGRFIEGVKANQKAIALSDTEIESYQWNLGICATGANEGDIALGVWKAMEQKIEMGQFGLPEGRYPSCKVRLAERPLAMREANNDDPGIEETVWIERLSPCHGIVRSVLYQELGTDYGDVILIDGAPVTYHTYGDKQIPVFPHLTTLRKHNYQFYHFAGTQEAEGILDNVSDELEDDAIVYCHSENFRILCSTCWRDQSIDHEHTETEEKHVVIGRIAAPPYISPEMLLRQIDSALKNSPENRIFSPELCRAAGQDDRARIEERRYNMLYGAANNQKINL